VHTNSKSKHVYDSDLQFTSNFALSIIDFQHRNHEYIMIIASSIVESDITFVTLFTTTKSLEKNSSATNSTKHYEIMCKSNTLQNIPTCTLYSNCRCIVISQHSTSPCTYNILVHIKVELPCVNETNMLVVINISHSNDCGVTII